MAQRDRSYKHIEQAPTLVGEEARSVATWIQRVLEVIILRINSPSEIRLEARHAEPDRPRHGMIVYADGTNWNPGSGEGIYYYKSTDVWTLLG